MKSIPPCCYDKNTKSSIALGRGMKEHEAQRPPERIAEAGSSRTVGGHRGRGAAVASRPGGDATT